VLFRSKQAKVSWEAKYSFGKSKRMVHNKIDANFIIQDGLIILHNDVFNLYKWSRMAFGSGGILLGWTGLMQDKIRAMAAKNLKHFMDKNPEYK